MLGDQLQVAVIEDDSEIMAILVQVLGEAGFDVITVPLPEALSRARDVIITDTFMASYSMLAVKSTLLACARASECPSSCSRGTLRRSKTNSS